MNNICVLGLGYVGFPLLMRLVNSGYSVIGYDSSKDKMLNLQNRVLHYEHLDKKLVEATLNQESVLFTSNILDVNSEVFIICVPTPLDTFDLPDLSYVIEAVNLISKVAKSGNLIINESTSYPGTLRNIVRETLYKNRPDLINKLYFGSAPERLSPSSLPQDLESIPRVIGGLDEVSTKKTYDIYSKISSKVYVAPDAETAEATKILENSFRLVNISFVNEISRYFRKIGIDSLKVIELAGTKPYGFMPFYPTVYAGGHCIPVDSVYLAKAMESEGIEGNLLNQAIKINKDNPLHISRFLKSKSLELNYNRILIIGVSYKSGVKDTRESSAEKLKDHLEDLGIDVDWFDFEVDTWGDKPKIIPSMWNGKIVVILNQDNIERIKQEFNFDTGVAVYNLSNGLI